MKLALCTLTAIGLAGFALAAGGCKESGIDARKTADALSEEFTDGIDFEDATVEDGQPPESTVDEPMIWEISAPRAIAPTAQNIPQSVEYGQQFDIYINTSQLIAGGNALGVIAHVQQANKDDQAARYYRIEPPVASFVDQSVTLRATFVSANPIGGNAFHIRLAILMANGDVGPYKDWNVVTYPLDGENLKVKMCLCDADTRERPTYEVPDQPDRPLVYQQLTRTNIKLSPQCSGDARESLLREIEGYPGDEMDWPFDANPCGLMHSCYGVDFEYEMDLFPLPSGTRFRPYWVESYGADPADCWVQIDCN